jgi:hypothetical protein
MPPLVPHRFLVRVTHPCHYVKKMPLDAEDDEHILDLPDAASINNFAELDGTKVFADVRLAWNELGIGVKCRVSGKSQPPVGQADKPFSTDGLSLWIDTRDARASHRASRYCHVFHLLAAGAGPDQEEAYFVQTKINRALQDAPLCDASSVPFRFHKIKKGYEVEAFLPLSVLNGFDPEQHPKLGFYYQVRDTELGDQFLGVGNEFPIWDDPSLWEPLELLKVGKKS